MSVRSAENGPHEYLGQTAAVLAGPGMFSVPGQIKPMAPSVNKKRNTELKKIEEWFKRNCKWVMGRECTRQEKGDFLSYLSKL